MTIPLAEAQARLAELVEKPSPGEELVLTQDDRPVARLVLLQGFAGVGPVKGVGNRGIIVLDKLSDFRLQFGHRGEVAPTQAFAMQDTEEDFDLVEPRTVFGQIDEADAVARVREELTPAAHRFQDALGAFFQRSATRLTVSGYELQFKQN